MSGLLDWLGPGLARAPREAADDPGGAMLATLSSRRDFDDRWIFERKLDGIRALAVRQGRGVRVLSRGAGPLGGAFPELVDALAGQEDAVREDKPPHDVVREQLS